MSFNSPSYFCTEGNITQVCESETAESKTWQHVPSCVMSMVSAVVVPLKVVQTEEELQVLHAER